MRGWWNARWWRRGYPGIFITSPGGSGGSTSPGGTSGQVQYNNSGAFGGFTTGGDGTLNTSTGALTVTKTNGTAFAPSATTDTTNASNISSGTLPNARISGWPLIFFSSGTWNSSLGLAANNDVAISGIVLPYPLTFGHIAVNVNTADASNNYDIGIYTAAGVLVADIGPQTLPSTGFVHFTTVQGSQTIAAGLYLFAWTGAATTAKLTLQTQNNPWIYNTNVATSTGGQLPTPITAQTPAPASGTNNYFVLLY